MLSRLYGQTQCPMDVSCPTFRSPSTVSALNQDLLFGLPGEEPLYTQPVPSELFVSSLPSRATPAAQEGATPGSSRCATAWKCLILIDFSYTYPSPPSLARFVSLPRPIRWAPAGPQSFAPSPRIAAALDGSPPAAASSTAHA